MVQSKGSNLEPLLFVLLQKDLTSSPQHKLKTGGKKSTKIHAPSRCVDVYCHLHTMPLLLRRFLPVVMKLAAKGAKMGREDQLATFFPSVTA